MKFASLSLHPGEPFPTLGAFRRELLRHFAHDFEPSKCVPRVNLTRDSNEAVISVELPGADPSQLEVTLHKGHLLLRGAFETFGPTDETRVCHLKERPTGSFSRSIPLPFETDESAVSADFQNGILTLRLPRAAASQPRTIPISSN